MGHGCHIGIDKQSLLHGDGWRQKRLLDRIGVNTVVDLGERALEIPAELEPVVLF